MMMTLRMILTVKKRKMMMMREIIIKIIDNSNEYDNNANTSDNHNHM